MKVHIVGGNSQVGTELALLYREQGHDVVPVVRSRRSAWFLDHAGFDYRVADVTDPSDAGEVLRDAELVVVTAFASKHTREGFRPDAARETNLALASNPVEYAPDDSTVVYFSTVHAFGDTVGPSDWTWYGREKRAAEKRLLKAAKKHDRSACAFRLGHVFGANQNKTRKIIRPVSRGAYERVAVDADKPSNVVHTATIADALLTYHEADYEPDVYTVVSDPQWSWRDVYDYYTDDETSISYAGDIDSGDRSLLSRSFGRLIGALEPYRTVLTSFLLYAPEPVNRRLSQRSRKSNVRANITAYRERNTFHTHEFDYEPAPGPHLSGVAPAEQLLEEYTLDGTALEPTEADRRTRTAE